MNPSKRDSDDNSDVAGGSSVEVKNGREDRMNFNDIYEAVAWRHVSQTIYLWVVKRKEIL